MVKLDEALRNALLAALTYADLAGNTLIGAMLADCLAQLPAEAAGGGDAVG